MEKKRKSEHVDGDDKRGPSSKEKMKKKEIEQFNIDDQPGTSKEETINNKKFPPVVCLNVGGTKFVTRLTTLRKYPNSKLAAMFSGEEHVDQDKDDNYFIDRNGDLFGHILNFLRDEEYLPPRQILAEVSKETKYYKIFDSIGKLKEMPSYFAYYIISENNRKAAEECKFIKSEVLKRATSNVKHNETTSWISKSSILLVGLATGLPLRSHTVSTFDINQLLNRLVPEEYENRAVYVGRENSEKFTEFADTLVKVLQYDGFRVTSTPYNVTEDMQCEQYELERLIYNLKAAMVLSFEWDGI